jgi:hypothetical protein
MKFNASIVSHINVSFIIFIILEPFPISVAMNPKFTNNSSH